MPETALKKLAGVRRNELGQLLPGTAGINQLGRPGVGMAATEAWRKFLAARDTKRGKSRLRVQMELVYELSTDKENKLCLEAIKYSNARAFGDIPKEVGQSVLAASLLQALPEEHKAFIAQLAFGDSSMLLPENINEDDEEDTEPEVKEE